MLIKAADSSVCQILLTLHLIYLIYKGVSSKELFFWHRREQARIRIMYVYCYTYVDKRALDNSLDLEDDNSFGFYVSFCFLL